jgi:hypothetical protein
VEQDKIETLSIEEAELVSAGCKYFWECLFRPPWISINPPAVDLV